MIVPTKGVHPKQALLTVGGQILDALEEPLTVSRLWTEIKDRRYAAEDAPVSFDWFVLALDLVRALDVVHLNADGFLTKVSR